MERQMVVNSAGLYVGKEIWYPRHTVVITAIEPPHGTDVEFDQREREEARNNAADGLGAILGSRYTRTVTYKVVPV